MGKKKNRQETKSVTNDPRFASVHKDPRFIRPSKREHKVAVDDRFKHLFEETSGDKKSRPRVDQYGRSVGDSHEQDQLKEFYHLDEEDQDSDQQDSKGGFIDYARGEALMSSSDEESSDNEDDQDDQVEEDSDEEEEEEVVFGNKKKSKRRSKDHEDSDPEGFDIDLDEDAVPTTSKQDDEQDIAEPSKRLAVVNLDWDNVKAIDIFKVLSSVLSPSAVDASLLPPPEQGEGKQVRVAKGYVKRVSIYPSEFGKQRMEQEAREGPPKDIFLPKKGAEADDEILDGEGSDDDEEDDDIQDVDDLYSDEESEEFNQRALRKYQLERLRYYYAIAEFDTVNAASHVFAEVDGAEFEATANTFDLSFVPEDMSFDTEPKDVATADMQDYKGVNFTTDALRHSKVKLTWDADDPDRIKLTKMDRSKMNKKDLEKFDYSNYIASSSSEGEEDEEEQEVSDSENDGDDNLSKAQKRAKLRSLYGLDDGDGESDEEMGEMQITFTPALSEKQQEKPLDEETSLETYKRKERERQQKKKERKRMANADGQDEDDAVAVAVAGSSDEDEDAGFNDPFFDDSDNDESVKKAKNSKDNKKDKEKRKDKDKSKTKNKGKDKDDSAKSSKEDAELALLVNSSDEEKNHFDMKQIMKSQKDASKKKFKKKKNKDENVQNDDFQINVGDSRFDRLFEDHEYAIDPSNPQFKKTKAMSELLQSSQKKRAERLDKMSKQKDSFAPSNNSANENNEELSSLVERIKRKSSSSKQSNAKRVKK